LGPALNLSLLPDNELIRRFQTGDDEAATVVYQRYAPRLRAIAQSRCGRRFASRFDPDDVVQAVFRDLFAGRLHHGPKPPGGNLWGFLMVLTLNKIRNLVEHHSAAKRSVRRTSSSDCEGRNIAVCDPRAQTIDAVDFAEQVDSLPRDDGQVIRMRLEGFEVNEIVSATGRSRRTIERVLQNFRERLATTY
jgi:RNA polymerase sigma-70 factor (ECF subfamily)